MCISSVARYLNHPRNAVIFAETPIPWYHTNVATMAGLQASPPSNREALATGAPPDSLDAT